ncbi:MAG: radical SAM/SPASM domain-containing protein [Patescibacteria group bacterium]
MISETDIGRRYDAQGYGPGLRYGIIEVTTRCQCACPGCYMVRRDGLNHGDMPLAQAVRILDLCREYTGRELETMDLLGGDPLLWPHLKAYLTILLDRGILPWVFTNMIAITPELARWLFEREIHVTGKLNINPDDPGNLELQAEMIGQNASVAKKMVEAISVFTDAGYRQPLFRAQNLIRRNNIHLVPDYYRWCLQRDIGTDLELMASGEPVDEEYFRIAPTPVELAVMIRKVQAVRSEFNLPPADVLMPHVFGACPFYDKGLYFAVNGSIRACSNSNVNLSHLDEDDPVRRAFESPLICSRLKLTKETVGEPCRSCDRWDRCRGGCRATVEGGGDPFGGYALCPLPHLSESA